MRQQDTVEKTHDIKMRKNTHNNLLHSIQRNTALMATLATAFTFAVPASNAASEIVVEEIIVAQEEYSAPETQEGIQGYDDEGLFQINEETGTISYDVKYFDKFAPQNALEMVRRIPGFSLNGGSDARGFGGTAGNVLLDGARPVSKNGLQDVLRRIPATQVKLIEVTRGGVGASQTAGQTVVANVVRLEGASTGTARVGLERSPNGALRPRFEFTYATTLDGWETSSRLSTGTWSNPRNAIFRDFDVDGNLTSTTTEFRLNGGEWAWYTGEASKNLFGGRLVVNTRFGGGRPGNVFTREIFEGREPDGRPDEFVTIDQPNSDHAFELGADWSTTTAKQWNIRLLSLTAFESRTNPSLFIEENNRREQTFLEDSLRERDTIETILRTTVGKGGAGRLKPEFGAELAYNQLVSTLDLFEEDENGPVDIDVPSANAKVAEIRGEVFTNLVWQAGEKLTLDGGLTWEISRLRVTGDANSTQTFKFFKPTLTATYNVRDNLQFQLQGVRQIGQLDFDDFAASNDVAVERVLAGNPELRPDRTWRATTRIDWQFSQRGSLNLRGFVLKRQDLLEQVILPSGGSGRGNAGSANIAGFDVEANLPLDFALPGGLLELTFRRRRTTFFDPIINADRNISDRNLRKLDFRFRQDITEHRVAWGVSLEGRFDEPNFFVEEVNTFSGNDRFTFFVETTRWFGVKTRLEVENFNGARFTSQRNFFEPDRGGEPDGSQTRRFRRGANIILEVTSQF
ncbi:TonB-dependent receptor plug domain-containing protein [Kordiimonas aquimaris]|uniref:TonB-dependent receptor plug domain-containing protein n=1 Tax=Kordiimonas aquimaris TaxID=707591 RepID=UPI0021CE7D5C|nr:TonB-dependent receptor plug domain-containing protein [Kordiimonas aquimaris]